MKSIITVGLLVLLTFHTAVAQALDFSPLSEFVERSKAKFNMPSGTAIAVVKGDKVVYEGYFGYADMQAKTKVEADTTFYIASSTKPLFAMAALLAIDEGKLATETSLQTLFPEIEFSGFNADAITVTDLLTHTTGVDNKPLVWVTAYSGTHTLKSRNQLVAASYANLDAPHGTFDYSNVGYNILGVWFDNTFELPWQATLQRSVLAPLGMTRTSALMSEAVDNKWPLAKPYSFSSPKPHRPLYLSKQDNTMHSAGGLVSTANDLARFVIAQLNEGKIEGEQVIPQKVIRQSQQVEAQVNKPNARFPREGYAWGWYVGEYLGQRFYHHFGGFAGTAAHVSFMPDQKIGLVILNNEDRLHGSNTLSAIMADGIYTLLLNQNKPTAKHQAEVEQLLDAKLADLVELVDRVMKREKESRVKRAERAWQLSREDEAYTGNYRHPLLGTITVSRNQADELFIEWGNLVATATAFKEPETIRVELVPGRGEVIRFSLIGRQVSSMELDGMVFAKQ